MGIDDIPIAKESDQFYWIKLNNRLFNTGYNFCMHECRTQDDTSEMDICYDYCYTKFMVGKKQIMHQAQDADEETFTQCLAEKDDYDNIDTILKCSQKMHSTKMLLIADSLSRT